MVGRFGTNRPCDLSGVRPISDFAPAIAAGADSVARLERLRKVASTGKSNLFGDTGDTRRAFDQQSRRVLQPEVAHDLHGASAEALFEARGKAGPAHPDAIGEGFDTVIATRMGDHLGQCGPEGAISQRHQPTRAGVPAQDASTQGGDDQEK